MWAAMPLLAALPAAAAAPAQTPTLGWNSWYGLGKAGGWPDTTAATIKETADLLASTGLAALGYRTVVIDDSWQATRYASASAGLEPDHAKFPGGMPEVVQHLRSLGLTLGLYTTPGNYTCSGEADASRRGSYGHVRANIALWVGEWGAGYVKNCVCNTTAELRSHAYADMRAAIDGVVAAGRAPPGGVVYECNNNMDRPWETEEVTQCNIWAVSDDVPDDFAAWTAGVDTAVQQRVNRHAGPAAGGARGGGWSSFDYLQVGGGGQTWAEYRAQMSMFAVLAAPIFIGTDLRNISADALAVYAAPEVLAVSQDAGGVPGTRVWQDTAARTEAWVRPLTGGRGALLLLNRSPAAAGVRADWASVGRVRGMAAWRRGGARVALRDAWRRADVPGTWAGGYTAPDIPPHSCVLLVGRLLP